MATADARFEHVGRPTKAPTPYAVEGDRGILQRWRERNAQHKRARLVSARNRRRLVRWLRRTARDANERRIRPGPEVLLHYRTAAVRADLLEVAALLERAHDPDPDCVKEIQRLLDNGDSPLYHPGIHVSELYATLHYVRAGLVRNHASCSRATPATPAQQEQGETNADHQPIRPAPATREHP